MYQNATGHNAVFAFDEPGYRWHRAMGGKMNGGLAVSGTKLFVETFAPDVVALDRRSGRVLWRTPMPDVAMTTPIVAGGLAIVGTGRDRTLIDTPQRTVWGRPQGDEIVALDVADGAIRWRYATVGEDMPSPVAARVDNVDAIVFANGDDRVRALAIRDGRSLWSTPVDGVATMSSANAKNGVVYVDAGPSASSHRPDRVYAIRASDGAVVWSVPYGNADVSPVVGGGEVVVESAETTAGPPQRNAFNGVVALDSKTGRLKWSRESALGFFSSAGSNEEAVAGTIDGSILLQSLPAARRFAAFDLSTGRPLWSIATRAAVKMSAVAYRRRVYFGDTSGAFYVVDEDAGRVLAGRRFPLPFTCSAPVIVGSTLYVAGDTALYALPLDDLGAGSPSAALTPARDPNAPPPRPRVRP